MKPQLIIIEAGHGGKRGLESDPGAVANGIVEREFTVDIARRVLQILQSKNELADCLLQGMGIERGVWFAQKIEEANVFCQKFGGEGCYYFAIHANASASTSASGIEIYVKDDKGVIKPIPNLVAESIERSFQTYFPDWETRNPCIRPAINSNAKGINDIWANSLLIECGFITNSTDAEIMSNRSRMAECIANGILNFIRNERQNS